MHGAFRLLPDDAVVAKDAVCVKDEGGFGRATKDMAIAGIVVECDEALFADASARVGGALFGMLPGVGPDLLAFDRLAVLWLPGELPDVTRARYVDTKVALESIDGDARLDGGLTFVVGFGGRAAGYGEEKKGEKEV
jgi:hypothetical protein